MTTPREPPAPTSSSSSPTSSRGGEETRVVPTRPLSARPPLDFGSRGQSPRLRGSSGSGSGTSSISGTPRSGGSARGGRTLAATGSGRLPTTNHNANANNSCVDIQDHATAPLSSSSSSAASCSSTLEVENHSSPTPPRHGRPPLARPTPLADVTNTRSTEHTPTATPRTLLKRQARKANCGLKEPGLRSEEERTSPSSSDVAMVATATPTPGTTRNASVVVSAGKVPMQQQLRELHGALSAALERTELLQQQIRVGEASS